jgi:hypothetical protein
MVTKKVGDVSANCSDLAKAYKAAADDLDPSGVTTGIAIVLPKFGGLSIDEKEQLAEDTDAVQPSFVKGQNDIPGGPDEQGVIDDILGRRY